MRFDNCVGHRSFEMSGLPRSASICLRRNGSNSCALQLDQWKDRLLEQRRRLDVVDDAKSIHARDKSAYDDVVGQLSDCLSQLSAAREALSRAGDIEAAMRLIVKAVPELPTDTFARLAAVRRVLVERRSRLARANEAVQRGRDVALLRQEFDRPEAQQRRETARRTLASAASVKDVAERASAMAERELIRERQADAAAAALALLVEHGERIGLQESHCPLCAAFRTAQEFESGLALARERLKSVASVVDGARQAVVDASATAERALEDFATAESEWIAIEREGASVVAQEKEHVEVFEQFGLDSRFVRDPDKLENENASERDQLIDLERALLTVEASQIVSETIGLEDRISALRRDVDMAADGMERSQAAVEAAKAIERAVKRVNAEIIDEQLAQIRPLMNELYQRLRPHVNWREMDYRIRGDVRRFLSLQVGAGLNPQFVLSSGQRRAAGLAFLLSVYLSRAWTPFRTLLLDDPVQHIDDFRALHFAEILAAFRLDDRQIVCTVEDDALADLLCRRLSNTPDRTGRRYDIDLDREGVAAVATETEILPLSAGVFFGRSEMQNGG